MQTQQDLIDLIGLKLSDEKLIAHFDAIGVKQPKSCTPNNSSNVNDKAKNVSYYFGYEVTHEALYPPKMEGKPKKWASYLRTISLVNESTIFKKPDVKPASFWNVTPPPTADLATLEQYFGKYTNYKFNKETVFFNKKINDLVEITCWFGLSKQRYYALEAKVIESRELISYLYFRDVGPTGKDDSGGEMAEQNVMCLLIKWLHDNKHLNIAQNEHVDANLDSILSFVRGKLKGKLWKNQLVNQERIFANFVADCARLQDENGNQLTIRFKEIALQALGQLEEYKEYEAEYDRLSAAGKPTPAYWEKQEAMVKNIAINDANYALFAKAVDENLAMYNKLMQLQVNIDEYNLI